MEAARWSTDSRQKGLGSDEARVLERGSHRGNTWGNIRSSDDRKSRPQDPAWNDEGRQDDGREGGEDHRLGWRQSGRSDRQKGQALTPPRLRRFLAGVGLCATALFVYLVRDIIPPFLMAAALAYLLNPLVNLLQSRGLTRVASILIVYAVTGSCLYLAGAFAIPKLLRETASIGEALSSWPEAMSGVAKRLETVRAGIDSFPALKRTTNMIAISIEEGLVSLTDRLRDSLMASISGALYVAIAPVLAFYILKDYHLVSGQLMALLPRDEPFRSELVTFFKEIDRAVGGFIRGQLLVVVFVAAAASAVTSYLRLPFPLILGIIAGTAEAVPYFGPIIGSIPAIAVALSRSPWLAVKTSIAFLAIQQVEACVIAPKVIGDRVGLHPLVVIFALMAGGRLFGPWGLILAVPVTGVLKALARLLANTGSEPLGE